MATIFDIETDGIEATKVHCIGAWDTAEEEPRLFGPDALRDGLEFLSKASLIVGHSILTYDLPVLRRLLEYEPPAGVPLYDTLAAARFWFPDEDMAACDRKKEDFPKELFARHSLAAWGNRLGVPKSQQPEDWSDYTEEMGAYCLRDLHTTRALYMTLLAQDLPSEALSMEQRFFVLCSKIRNVGVPFDTPAAEKLRKSLMRERAKQTDEVQSLCSGWVEEYETPKKKLKRTREIPFNPRSRQHVARFLTDLGWKPRQFTETGLPKVDEKTLQEAADRIPQAAKFSDLLVLQKRLGQLAEGEQALLKHVTDAGRIHGYISHNGACTTRCTHSRPNLAQVPRDGKPYGGEFRDLFRPPQGVFVGADQKGLELRTLAHYLVPFGGEEYIKVVTEGDPHAMNQKILGLADRSLAKTFIYALIYGASDRRLGSVVHGGAKEGRAMRAAIQNGIPGLGQLVAAVQRRVKQTGKLKALDGRSLRVRSEHSALNTLLQSGGSLLMKMFAILVDEYLSEHHQGVARIVLQVHDEIQIEVLDPKVAEDIKVAVEEITIEKVPAPFGFRCPLSCDVKIGKAWRQTH